MAAVITSTPTTVSVASAAVVQPRWRQAMQYNQITLTVHNVNNKPA